MSFAPFKLKKVRGKYLRRADDGESWWDRWGEEIGLAAIEAVVLCAPVVAAGTFELYIARERARLKLEIERVRAAHRAIEKETDDG